MEDSVEHFVEDSWRIHGEFIGNSVGDSVEDSVEHSVGDSVEHSVEHFVGDSCSRGCLEGLKRNRQGDLKKPCESRVNLV